MRTAVTKRGQTVVPAPIRKRYGVNERTHLVWIDDGKVIRVIPVPDDSFAALRGRGQGEKGLERLLRDRQEDKNREG